MFFSILEIENIKKQIINLLTNRDLPVALVYYLLKDILNEIEKIYKEAMIAEIKQDQETPTEEE